MPDNLERNLEYYKGLFKQAQAIHADSPHRKYEAIATMASSNPDAFEALVSRMAKHDLDRRRKARKKSKGLLSKLLPSKLEDYKDAQQDMRESKRTGLRDAASIWFNSPHRDDDLR